MGRSVIVPEMVEGEFLFKRFGAVVADYERAADEDTRLELLDGVMIMHSPANVTHERLFWFLGSVLRAYAEARRLGVVLGSRTAMILEEERRFEPDLLFVKNANLARLGDVWLEGPADLVVEIISLATREYDLGEKRDAYAAAHIPEYWMIDPVSSRFMVDRPAGQRVTEMTRGRYESESLSGFWLDVGWLWQDPLPEVGACAAQILGAG